ncbi:MAG: hypothetical protein DRI95_12335 [Bacteroidetes bacterium]|nr:MAG: hypothetical protein DRI95_12335 [Bacteroidota bacterium]
MIETIGYIKKEEQLVSLEHDIIPNTQVIETRGPFPGYHGKDLPGELSASAPEFVFFVTKQKYTTDHIARVTKNIKKYFVNNIDIARAEINIFNTKYPCIRVKNCEDFSKIAELQACYNGEGIKFAKKKKVDTVGLIKIQKHFHMEEIGNGIFKDMDEENTSYLQIPVELKWPQFKSITFKIKNNMEDSNFDAALGLFYREGGLIDFVRIYDESATIERLEDIKTRYMNEISRILLNS